MSLRCLLVVESPAKAKTILRYLEGRPEHWIVRATKGHVADLPLDRIGIVDDSGRYQGEWLIDPDKRALLKKLRDVAAECDRVFIGSDDDREGERIAHDVVTYLKISDYTRITFREITAQAINESIDGGMGLVRDNRVDAQMARRLVDREIGYPVSQIIRWHFTQTRPRFTPRGVGRVISPALGILAETERDIAAFVPETYERIACDYLIGGETVRMMHDKKFKPAEWQERDQVLADLRCLPHLVYNYQKRNREIPPYPPFTTARLQRCAFYLFGFDPKLTMRLAQDLYEGMDTSEGRHGLITYPRSDSHNVSDHAVADIISLLNEHVPAEDSSLKELILSNKRPFKSPPSSQGAHESIRPTHFETPFWPSSLTGFISDDHRRLYELIWFRTLSTQLKDAVYDVSSVEVSVGEHRLHGQANHRLYQGWEYLDGHRAHVSERHDEERHVLRPVRIPPLEIGAELDLLEAQALELTTRRPQRFGIGRFLTVLDGKGIARPSTLDSIVHNLAKKGYVEVRKGFLYVTDTGMQVDDWTMEYCPWLSDVDHARVFEERLDAVEEKRVDYNLVISEYVDLVEALKSSLGYSETFASSPTDAQLEYARRLASENGVNFPDDIASDPQAIRRFIDAYRPQRELVGKCPSCHKRTVYSHEKVVACNAIECDFKIYHAQIEAFIRNFSLSLQPADVLSELLARKQTLFLDMRSPKKGSTFNAYVGFEKKEGRWSVSILRFARARKPEPLVTGS